MRRALLLSISIAIALSFAVGGAAQSPKANSRKPEAHPPSVPLASPAAMQAARASFAKLPLSFEENRGQTDARVKYVSRGPGYNLFLTSDQAVLALRSGNGAASCIRPDRRIDRLCAAAQKADLADNGSQGSVLWLRMLGASDSAQVVGSDELAGKLNYYVGNDPRKWHAGVPLFARVTYRGIYPGVDLTYYGNQQQLESDYVVAPGANPRNIEFEVAGAKQVRLDANGNLILTTSVGNAQLLRPGVYQTIHGERHNVAGHYILHGGNRVGFEIAAYDTHTTLVIDPVLVYATYLGGSASFGADEAQAITVDATGEYVTGSGTSTDFPGSDPNGPLAINSDGFAFVTKFDTTGSTLLYSTLLSGTSGFGTIANGIGIDSSHNAYIAGTTEANDFPTLNPYQATFGSGFETAFVAGLSSNGTLTYSTFLGGRNENDESEGMGLFADASGNAYVVGDTDSQNFPTLDPLATSANLTGPNATNVFVAKFNPQGQPIYSTYLGGAASATAFESDQGNAIVADASGNAYVTGSTSSATFPVVPSATAFQKTLTGSQNVFITKLSFSSSTLTIAASTYLGGSATDAGMGIAIDSASPPNVYLTGSTSSSGAAPNGFPTKNALFSANGGATDAFITKLTGDFTALVFSTYLGGSVADTGFGISLDTANPPNVYVTGSTSSTNFPLSSPLQATLGTSSSNTNAFITALNGAGTPLIYSTYLGGNGSDTANGIFADTSGNVYVAGETTSQNFPVQGSAGGAPFQGSLGSSTGNAFVAKISPAAAPVGLNFFPSSFNFQSVGLSQTSSSERVTLSNNTASAVTITAISVGGTNASDFAQTNNCPVSPATLAAGASCAVTVTFSPKVQDTRTAQINVTSTASTNGTLTLTGFGAVPEISLSSTSLNFGANDPLNVQAVSGVLITNTGGAGGVGLQLGSFQIQGTNASAFTVISGCGTTPVTLTPGNECEVELGFTPTAPGPYSATLLINDNAAGSPQQVTLTGTGVALVNVGPSSQEFGGVLLTAKSADRSYSVTNGSGSTLTVTSIVKGGSNPGDYVIDTANSTCNSAASFQLVAGGTCQLDVFFQPTAGSAFDGRTASFTFNYTSTAVSGAQTVNAVGTGETGVTLYLNTVSPTEYVGISTSTNGGDILFNGTGNPITITSIVLTGNNATDYTVQIVPSCAAYSNGVIAANSMCNIGGTFTPSAVGPRTATATINYTGSGGGALVINLNGTGLLYPVQFPTSYDFGSEIVNTTAPTNRFEYQNAAKVPVTISAITPPTNADFHVVAQTCVVGVVPGGGNCYIDMNFTPHTAPPAAESDTLTITDNGNSFGTQQPRTLALKGTSVPAAVTISANPVDFGNVVVGKTAMASFFLTNGGSGPATITVAPALTTTTGTPFTLVTGTSGECVLSTVVLGSGGTCSVILKFAPTAAGAATPNSVTLTDSTGGLHTVTIQGTGVFQGIAGMSPSTLMYTQAANTTSTAQTATLTNSGNGPLTVTAISVFNSGSSAFSIATPASNACTVGMVLTASPGPGNTCNVAATFTAPATGTSFFGELEVSTNLGNGVTNTASTFLEGTVSASGGGTGFTLTPAGPIAFGTVPLNSFNSSAEYELINNNSVPVTFSSVAFQTATTQYTISFQTCTGSQISANGGECFFELEFVPTSPGLQSNALQFTYTNATGLPASPFSVSVTGTGSNAVIASPNPLVFPALSLANASNAQSSVTISNGSATQVTINSVGAITGTGSSVFTFTPSSNSCTSAVLAASFGSCSIGITYTPTGSSSSSGQFIVNYTPQGGSATTITVQINGSATAPVATVTTPASGAPLVFPSQTVNTASQPMNIVLTNQGTDNLSISSIQTSSNDFSFATPSNSATACLFGFIAPGQSCVVPVVFTPSASGARTGTLTITDNSVPTKTQTVTLNGTGAGGSVTVSPTTYNFPQTNIGSSVTQAAVVTNTTGSAVTFNSVGFTGPYSIDTTQTANACVNGKPVPAVNGSCAVYIKFSPAGITNAGTAQISTTPANSLSITLSGAGSSPTVIASPTALTFTTQLVGTTSSAQTVTLTNGTASSITISSVVDSNSSEFPQTTGTTCMNGVVVPAAGSCIVNIAFDPSGISTRSGTLTINDSPDGLSPHTITLSGTGTAPASITATSGTPQSMVVNTAFSSLQATVKDSGNNLLSGVTVTFTATPAANGASGTFANGTSTTTAVTNASGVATASTFTANTLPGAYTVAATVGAVGPANFSLTNLAGTPASITATAGTPQSVAIGAAFPTALQATVKDSNSLPLGGITVTFTAPNSGASGKFANATVTTTAVTNASGVATASTFTANSTAGGPYNVGATAGAVGPANFSLTNLAGAPATVTPTAGTPQSIAISTPFPIALQTTVTDSGSNPLSGVIVTFTAPGSGASGTFANGTNTTTATTNGSGIATASTFTANTAVGGPYNVTATAGTAPVANFALTNLAGPPATITATAGTTQSVAISTAFPTALQATVKDSGGNLVSGATVTFTVTAAGNGASGTFANGTATTTATTNASGIATASTFTANAIAGGPYTVAAKVGAIGPANFSLTNLTGPAAAITATAGATQSITISTAFPTAFQATVKDSGGNLVSGATVTFTAPSSGASGTFANGTITTNATTNASGVATATTFTANTTAGGPYNVTATSGTATSATFSLTNLTGPATTITATAGTPQSAAVTVAFGTLLQATVKDAGGNLINGATVTFTVAAAANGASGTFANGTATTNATTSAGIATASAFTANAIAGGPYIVTATSGTATSATFSLTNNAGPAAAITATAGTPQTVAIGAAFPTLLQATVKDSHSNLVSGATVTFTAPSSGASGTFANGTITTNATTNASGVATATAFTANTTAGGPYNVTATSGAATSATFSLTNQTGPAAAITATSGGTQSVAVNTAFAAIQATVKDSGGNLVSGATVTFTVTAAGNGASGTFTGGVATAQATTSVSGIATAPTFTANSIPGGPYTITATSGTATSGNFTLTNLTVPPASIATTAGTPQSIAISTAFPTALQAIVKDSGSNPIAGVTVTFTVTAAGNGASGAFANGTATTTATTNASGIATASTFTANAIAGGPYTVGATAGALAPANFSLTNLVGAPATITTTGGGTQSATVGTAFASSLQATVKDSGGNLVSGASVTFTVTAATNGAGGTFTGSLTSVSVNTNASGVATAPTFTANNIAGGPYTVAAKAGTVGPANFSLTNAAGPAAVITQNGGASQSVAVNTAFATLQVTVKDTLGNPVSGTTVTFTATAAGNGAGGTFANGTNTTTAVTNSSGIAAASTFTANTVPGGPYTVAATAGALAPANFSLTNLAGTPASITTIAGTPQSVAISTAFTTALQATVKDSNSLALQGVIVTFTAPSSGASGTFANGTNTTTATTNASGIATASTFTANSTAGGPYNVGATAGAVGPVNFSLTNLAGAPASITATAGTPQSVAISTAFPTALQATVKDSGGNLLSGVIVTFTVTAAGNGASGTFTGSQTTVQATTNASGVATAATFTANTIAGGPYTVAATAGTATAGSFSLTNLTGPPAAITATAGATQSHVISSAFPTAFQATVKDSGGNLVSGATVTFTVTAATNGASGTFTGALATAQATTNASGVATAPTFTANGIAGAYIVTATSGTATSATFSLTNQAGPPASIAPTAGTPQSAPVTTAFATNLQATVKDSGGNLVSGATVTFTVVPVSGAGGTFAGGATTATTNASGVATAAVLTANATGGAFTVNATVTGVATPAVFSLTNTVAPDVTITESHTGDFVVNANGVYTIKVTNNGTGPTTGNVTVTDTLATGLTFVSGAGTGWACTATGQVVTCTYTGAALAAAGGNSTFTLTVSVAPSAFPSVVNTATVADPNDSKTTDKSSAADTTQIDNVAPTQSSFSPSLGLIAGATTPQQITFTGTGFNSSTVVNFGTTPLTGGTANATGTSLTITVPVANLATAASVTVSVTNPKNPTSNNGGGNAPTTQMFPLVGFSVQVQAGTPNPVPVTAGTSATVQVNLPITPANAPLPAAVTITCTVPAGLTGATCTPNPSSIPQGSTTASSMVTISAVAMKSSQAPPASGGPGPWTPYLLWFAALAFATMAGILAMSRPQALHTRRGPAYATLLLLVLTAAVLAGCASNSPTPTPTGPSMVTVTATSADGATSSVVVPINVSN